MMYLFNTQKAKQSDLFLALPGTINNTQSFTLAIFMATPPIKNYQINRK